MTNEALAENAQRVLDGLRKIATDEAAEGEYPVQEHICYMAAAGLEKNAELLVGLMIITTGLLFNKMDAVDATMFLTRDYGPLFQSVLQDAVDLDKESG